MRDARFDLRFTWHHFAFAADVSKLGELARSSDDFLVLARFVETHWHSYENARRSVELAVPSRDVSQRISQVTEVLQKLGFDPPPTAFGVADGEMVSVQRDRWEQLGRAFEQLVRWQQSSLSDMVELQARLLFDLLGEPTPLVVHAATDEQLLRQWQGDEKGLGAAAVEICVPPFSPNLGLGAGYDVGPWPHQVDGDPWLPTHLALAEPLVVDGGEATGPVTWGRGAQLVEQADNIAKARSELESMPADLPEELHTDDSWSAEEAWRTGAEKLKGGLDRFERGCREVGGQGGAILSFVGKNPAL